MKKLLIILVITLVASCTADDDLMCPIPQTQMYNVIYDSQDNIVKLNGVWVQSIDLGTWEPANDTLGIRHDWDNRTLYLKSLMFQIESVELEGLGHYVSISENVATIYVPTMQEHMDNTDWFRLTILLK